MPHAVTQSCVGDGSCVYACPVNCIQPTPDSPDFELAEMLHIDPATCVDCGACVAACPVDAIKPHQELDASELAFLQINADHHRSPRARPALAPVPPPLRVRRRQEALRVAIVGSGPAAMYAADELLTIPGAQVTVLERLDRPYGLVHGGVAPDHRRTRRVAHQLERIREHDRLTMRLGVEVGRDVTHEQLLATHHAVIYAVGSRSDRRLQVPGADLPGVASATEFVGWYNGHPDAIDARFDLSQRRAVVIGNGNVALDLARILTVDPETLVGSDIAPHALEALRRSRIREVVVVGRRGPEHSAFTLPELVGLTATAGIAVTIDPDEFAGAPIGDPKLDLLRGLPAQPSVGRTIHLRYGLTPLQLRGTGRLEAIDLMPTDPARGGKATSIDTGLVLTAIGYRGVSIPSLPFDDATSTVPNIGGRVRNPATGDPVSATYVAGWIKRGPSGFIGTNKRCARETVEQLVEDYNAGALQQPPSTRRLASTGLGR
jgi:ferredoxin--NADP+ reductase